MGCSGENVSEEKPIDGARCSLRVCTVHIVIGECYHTVRFTAIVVTVNVASGIVKTVYIIKRAAAQTSTRYTHVRRKIRYKKRPKI